MHLHEYQAKALLKKYGIPVPSFQVVSSVAELKTIFDVKDWQRVVLKTQIHAGGRGKAGGVKLAKNPQEAIAFGKEMLGMRIINEQTGPDGLVSSKLIIGPAVDIQQEVYLGLVMDRASRSVCLLASKAGGMDIEEVAKKDPTAVLSLPIGPQKTLRAYQIHQLTIFFGWTKEQALIGTKIAENLTKLFFETDAELVEINPLITTKKGELVALDAKLTIDDNALFRQKELASFFDPTQISPLEVKAKEWGLSYIALDGSIGCMVNGAGLAMATLDLICHYGGRPANFLDVGGSATDDKIEEGLLLLQKDPKVKAIFINIFGGIMNCETIASGILRMESRSKGTCPIVVRMEGTNVEEARKKLMNTSLPITTASTLEEAAKVVVMKARGE